MTSLYITEKWQIPKKLLAMFCEIWHHLFNLKNKKNTHGGVLLLVKLQAFSLKLY